MPNLLSIYGKNCYKKGVYIMGSAQADLSFLTIMLMAFRQSSRDGLPTKRVVSLVMADILTGNIPECRNMTPKLFQNFLEGYKDALRKYGEEEANIRMQNYLTKVIIKHTGHTEDYLYHEMDMLWGVVELATEGIHLTQNENGEYYSSKWEEDPYT